jgi:hypothetical protein
LFTSDRQVNHREPAYGGVQAPGFDVPARASAKHPGEVRDCGNQETSPHKIARSRLPAIIEAFAEINGVGLVLRHASRLKSRGDTQSGVGQ